MNQIVKYIGIAILGSALLTSCGEKGLADNEVDYSTSGGYYPING